MSAPKKSWCHRCETYNYLRHKRCDNPDCPRNQHRNASSSSHGATSSNPAAASNAADDWWQHNAWQDDVWQEEHESAKDRRRKWWSARNAKKQKTSHSQRSTSPPAAGTSQSSSHRPTGSTSPMPEAKAMPKPKAKPSAKPPRGSAGRAPSSAPWKDRYISDSDESFAEREIITPGVHIEELLPELEWVPQALQIEDGAAGSEVEPPPPDPFQFDDDEEGEESEMDQDEEVEISSEMAARAARAVLKEVSLVDQSWNSDGGITWVWDEPFPEPMEHIAWPTEPAPEPSVFEQPAVAEEEALNNTYSR